LSTEPAIQTLIELSRDIDHNVRNWATFGLGALIDADSPGVRQALYDRLFDEDEETHLEAIWGLSQRKDPRVIDFLVKRLLSETVGFDDLRAAEAMGAPELLPALISLREWQFEGAEHLESAISICESNQ
jgi:HEAT repeat protein